MTTLHQIIAVEKGVKAKTAQDLAEAHRALGVPSLLSGISRTYQPKDDEGEQLPPESTRVQVKAEEVLGKTAEALTRLFDVTATKDWANCEAKADVVVDGRTLIADAPVSYLLFLEKQFAELHATVRKLPTLDPAEEWDLDANTGAYKTREVHTIRSRKVMRNHVVSEATAQHPAQVHVYQEDVPAGTWKTVKFSGALPAQRVNEIAARVVALHDAVKYAREHANTAVVRDVRVGEDVFGYLFG
jgi:hypothetical protein